MKAFLQPLQNLAEYEEITKCVKENTGAAEISGCLESQKVHMMYGLSGLFPFRLVLAEDERRAKEIYEDYRFYDPEVLYYPAKDLLFFEADIHGNLLIRQRMQALKVLMTRPSAVVVTSVDGCMDYLASLEKIRKRLLHLISHKADLLVIPFIAGLLPAPVQIFPGFKGNIPDQDLSAFGQPLLQAAQKQDLLLIGYTDSQVIPVCP